MKTGPTAIRSHLLPDFLKHLARELDDLSRLKLAWSRCMPAPLSEHTFPRQYEQGSLTIAAYSAAWASRLRQQQTGLIERLRREPGMAALRDLSVRIVPKGESDPAAELRTLFEHRKPPQRLSPESARLLREVADRVSDPDLSAALNRLANRAAQGDTARIKPTMTGRNKT